MKSVSKTKIALWVIYALIMVTAACIGSLQLWVAVSTEDSAATADEFITKLENRKMSEAYASTSALFRAEQELWQFESVVDRIGVINFSMNAWRDRTLEREDKTAAMKAVILEISVHFIPVRITLVWEDYGWKVHTLTGPNRIGVGAGTWFQLLPTRQERDDLLRDTIADFADGVSNKDFTNFYENTGVGFKLSIPMNALISAYGWMIDEEIDLSGMKDVSPVYDSRTSKKAPTFEKTIAGDVYVVSGYLPTEPDPTGFLFRYVYQHPEWKLYKILVEKPGVEQLTLHQCMKWLITQAVKDPRVCKPPSGSIPHN